MNIVQGNLETKDYRFAIIQSRFNEFIGDKLLDGALDCLAHYNCPENNITVIKVPGAFEIPFAAQKLAEQKTYSAIICLGAVIRGATPHFDYVAENASRGIAEVSLKFNIPVTFGVLTTNTIEQANERSGEKSDNKGWDAALAAIEMADLASKLK
jgi:6,7-dimethyl-8-ribityllumazine synthase